MSALLPTPFAALEPFAADWAGETAADRARLRDQARSAQIRAFYEAAQPCLEPGLAYLDAKPLAEHDDKERRLMRLLLTLAHVAMAVEVQRDAEPAHALMRPHMRLTRAPADATP